jgi:hypothetical protein
VLHLLAGLAGLALARDRHGRNAEVFELSVDAGLAVAAVGGHPSSSNQRSTRSNSGDSRRTSAGSTASHNDG